ncbi:flagellar brake protein [Pseudoalteromonas sp.]|uniref:flagellar brake domain-containing protein n=1 Tax=Pseudoalteromonas sp. TaxID=53249 RepID=UPI001BCD6BB6|nr:flagellar brake protein [Pseudoalteromonas sp.]
MATTNLEKLHQITTGGMVELEILTPTSSRRIKTEFIGLLENKFIILNYPNAKRLPMASDYLYDGIMVVVRALIEGSEGHVIAFRQQIMSVSSHPARLLFIRFPTQVQLFELRSQARIPTLFPAKLKLTDQKPFLEGIIKDISLTGVMFDIKTTLTINDIKDARCNVIFDSETEYEGQICSVKKHAKGIYCGIRLFASEEQMKTLMGDHFIDPSALEV